VITRHPSPLRYPGGKTSLTAFLTEVIDLNNLDGAVYVEPFAGGAGAALKLLFDEQVSKIYINDLDKHIYCFWKAILNHTSEFTSLIRETRVSVAQWRKQQKVFVNFTKHSTLEIGFATFYLNRCNHSGVLNGGPIGGIDQTGEYKINARYNKAELQSRIEKISLYRDRIIVKNLDGVAFLDWVFKERKVDPDKSLVYMDPPYFEKAASLYDVYFHDSDHQKLAKYLAQTHKFRWIVSYDDSALVRKLYKDRLNILLMRYSVKTVRIGRELVISSSNCLLPTHLLGTQLNGFASPNRSRINARNCLLKEETSGTGIRA
jgi:DNA adenine methylase